MFFNVLQATLTLSVVFSLISFHTLKSFNHLSPLTDVRMSAV